MPGHGHQHMESAPETALDALLAAERDAAARLERARADAASLIASVTDEVAGLVRQLAATQAAAIEKADMEQQAALADIEHAVAQSAAQALTRYRGLTDAQVQGFASVVLTEITGLAPLDGT